MINKINNKTNYIKYIEKEHIRNNQHNIEIGDNIKIRKIIQEGNKERVQLAEGVVIAIKNSGINRTITIRKTIQNIGVERIYLLNSPKIVDINILRKSKVSKSKLYYLRSRVGKATRLKQKLV
uniref:Large ribosomal subunit protein bL19c n=1 Tax=Kapraunia schneideri TaxID=717899 RepID=A0A1Z1MT39_9FLOR|nr:ribosomal protein L19 [Kapraunia schneideri]ARW68992.1 ribosomal protein L19 [Kapraunia schneideri]